MKISNEQLIVDRAQNIKALFVGSGDQFKDAVASGLMELGMTVIDGPHPRADLIATYKSQIVAAEAKGIDGPAREVDVRQAEQWAADIRRTLSSSPLERKADPDLERYEKALAALGILLDDEPRDTECKSLLVVGTFRKVPLNMRKPDEDFPDAVARVLKRSTCCALTGLQLLVMLLEARRSPDKKDKLLTAMLSTDGALTYATDWSKFFTNVGG
jgi:hypothetical protein